ncbi:MAG: hypothetical protein ACRCVN_04320, partial [Spirochaetia bacterium]
MDFKKFTKNDLDRLLADEEFYTVYEEDIDGHVRISDLDVDEILYSIYLENFNDGNFEENIEDSPSYLYSRMIALSYCYMELLKRKTGDDNGGDRECSVCKKKINLE